MSSHFVIVIPEHAGAAPDDLAVRRARSVLEGVEALSAIESRRNDELAFIDCGENYESIACPACGADAMSWWSDAMDYAWRGEGFGDLSCTAPCCGARTTLHDLVYRWPQGFARFELRASNANGLLHPEVIAAVEAALGMRVRVIYARY